MRSLWIGAAGTGTGFGLALSAREGWGEGVRIVAADANPPELVATAVVADEARQMPFTDDPAFVDALLQGLADTSADTYVPILDSEIVLARQLDADGRLPVGIALGAPSLEGARLCLDKLALARWMDEHGVPGPRTWEVRDAPQDGRPLFAKPRRGVGSVGARAIGSAEGLRALADGDEGGGHIVQEACGPPEITVDAFRPRGEASVSAVSRERIEVKSGVCTKARVHSDEQASSLACDLALGLGLEGAFCFQLMRGAEERMLVTDVNPRHGAGSRMSAAVGFDIMAANLADLWGEDPSRFLRTPDRERLVLRQYREYVSR